MRPALRGLCKVESLFDGTLDLEQVALLNDALDISDYNDRKMREAQDHG